MSAPTPAASRRTAGRTALVVLTSVLALLLLSLVQVRATQRLVVVPWLALAPLVVALLVRWRATAVSAAASVLAVAALSERAGDLATVQGVIRVLGAAALAAFAIVSAAVRVAREERVRRVSLVAATAQAAILHPLPAQVAGVALASRYVSASADALVGGDLYDAVARDGGARLILGDARGKGLDALQTTAAVLSAFRHHAPRPGLDVAALARALDADISPALGDEDFVTALLVDVTADGCVQLASCGHPQALLLDPARPPAPVGPADGPASAGASLPLGLGADPHPVALRLGPGQRLLLFTDGLVEARDARGTFFDVAAAAGAAGTPGREAAREPGREGAPDRVEAVSARLDAELERLFARLQAHVGGAPTDDTAALLLQPLAIPGAADDAGGGAARSALGDAELER